MKRFVSAQCAGCLPSGVEQRDGLQGRPVRREVEGHGGGASDDLPVDGVRAPSFGDPLVPRRLLQPVAQVVPVG